MLGVEIHFAESYLWFGAEGIRMLRHIRLKLGIRWRIRRDCVFGQELQLLTKPPPNDGVVAIEAHSDGLADGNLVFHMLIDQPFELGLACRSLPARAKPTAMSST